MITLAPGLRVYLARLRHSLEPMAPAAISAGRLTNEPPPDTRGKWPTRSGVNEIHWTEKIHFAEIDTVVAKNSVGH
jgi:hypothetical protein